MKKKVSLYYIKTNFKKSCIISLERYIDPTTLVHLNHLDDNFYIGFSGFNEYGGIIDTPVDYDFYYFYNLAEDIRTIFNIVKFEKIMTANELIAFESERLRILTEQLKLINKELQNELVRYKDYEEEMKAWIDRNGTKGLKTQFYNNEDIQLSYLIERLTFESSILKKAK